jgi:crotonobetainyl-CoA:carnitine CoA-transferase CaiB-like acyl-CoA transferase
VFNLAKLTLIADLPGGEYLFQGYATEPNQRIRTGQTIECSALRAINFVGANEFEVSFANGELNELSDRHLKNAMSILDLESADVVRKQLAPEKKQSFVSKVLPKKTEKEETLPVKEELDESSDEADLADDSE